MIMFSRLRHQAETHLPQDLPEMPESFDDAERNEDIRRLGQRFEQVDVQLRALRAEVELMLRRKRDDDQ
jgi:hypothetical protein